jgi:hypothetical protein
MGLNDDQLTPAEHDDVRARLLAGTRRIKPAGAHRRAIVTTTVAVAVVAVLSVGAVGAANFLRMGDAAEPISTGTPTPSASPTPTPIPPAKVTPTPSASPATQAPTASLGVMPFGGECANTLTDIQATDAAGQAMQRSDFRWESGEQAVAGGIDCFWISSEEYVGATIHLYAYPDSEVPDDVRRVTGTGCELTEDGARIICDASGARDGVWLLVRTVGYADRVSPDGVQAAYDAAIALVAEYPLPKPADPTSEWWGALDCNALPGRIDPQRYGFDRVAKIDYAADAPPADGPHPGQIASDIGGGSSCDLHFTLGLDPNYTDYATAWVAVVPGGAVTFDSVESAEYGEPVQVDGAVSAMWVPGLDRYEGSWNVLAVSDGVNVLMLSDNGDGDLARLTLLAEELLAQLG